MSGRDWGDVAFAVLILAVIALMVRPSSLAPSLITQLGAAMTALVAFTADPRPGSGAGAETAPGES